MASFKARNQKLQYGEAPPKRNRGAALTGARLPPSLQKKSVEQPCSVYGPLPTPSLPGALVPGASDDEVSSEAQQQLQKLLAKQLDTSQSTLESALDGAREFMPAVVFQPLADEMKGLHTLSQFVSKEKEVSKVEDLRQLGLTEGEIELKLQELQDSAAPAKKRKLGAEPSAHKDRLDALNQKISERKKMIEEPTKYYGAKHMGRHAIELERSLFRNSETGSSLEHLTLHKHSVNETAYPKSLMTFESDKEAATTSEAITPLPRQVIERNRLTIAEIRALPRFTKYSPGEPSNVLYLKNMDKKVSVDDLQSLFGSIPSIRLMTGRMRGQAFVHFKSVEEASKALELVNGYIIRDRPVIISYGQTHTKTKTDACK